MRLTRHQIVVLVVLVTTAGGMGAALAGWETLSDAVTVVLVGALVIIGLDLRRRIAGVDRRTGAAARCAKTVQTLSGLTGPDGRIERMERRLLVELALAAQGAHTRHEEFVEEVNNSTAAVRSDTDERVEEVSVLIAESTKRTVNSLTHVVRDQTRQTEALLQALPRISPRALLPASGEFAMNPRAIAHLADLVGQRSARTVLELGTGTSTVWLAYLLQGTGAKIVSVDHDPHYLEATRQELQRHDLAAQVDLRLAPLVSQDGDKTHWYDVSVFTDVTGIDLLVVDGPPGNTGPLVRARALPLLEPQLAEQVTVVLDDADRPDEIAAIDLWLKSVPNLRQRDRGVSRLAVLDRG